MRKKSITFYLVVRICAEVNDLSIAEAMEEFQSDTQYDFPCTENVLVTDTEIVAATMEHPPV